MPTPEARAARRKEAVDAKGTRTPTPRLVAQVWSVLIVMAVVIVIVGIVAAVNLTILKGIDARGKDGRNISCAMLRAHKAELVPDDLAKLRALNVCPGL